MWLTKRSPRPAGHSLQSAILSDERTNEPNAEGRKERRERKTKSGMRQTASKVAIIDNDLTFHHAWTRWKWREEMIMHGYLECHILTPSLYLIWEGLEKRRKISKGESEDIDVWIFTSSHKVGLPGWLILARGYSSNSLIWGIWGPPWISESALLLFIFFAW